MLSGSQLNQLIERTEIEFSGAVRGDALLLTLGSHLLEFAAAGHVIKPWDSKSASAAYAAPCVDWEEYDLHALTSVIISVHERLRLSNNIGGAIGTLSHLARLGLFAHFASPFVDRGFEGHLALELFNASPNTLRLRRGMPMAKLLLWPVEGEPPHHGQEGASVYSSKPDSIIDLRSQFWREFGEGET